MSYIGSLSKSNNELIKRIFFVLFILIVCRIGAFIPIAGINSLALRSVIDNHESGIIGMFNMLSGGSLGRMSVFALAIMPYITSSIIIQILSVIYKPLDDLKKDGEIGKSKINQFTKYLTILLGALQAYGIAVGLERIITPVGPVVIISHIFFRIGAVTTIVVGTMLLIWLGEQITQRGIGNGSSLIIFIGIISGIPSSIINIFELSRKGIITHWILLFILTLIIVLICFIVFFEKAQRKVFVQYPKRQVGNKMYGGDATHMPLKLNTAGVIPPIFASSILLFPTTIGGFYDSKLLRFISQHLSHGKPLYVLCYLLLILFFSFFYTSIVFNTEDTAANLKKYGAYIPGRKPGKNTSEFLDYLLNRITVLGGIYLSIICILPEMLFSKYPISLSLGGTSFLIIVNVILDTFSQIQNYLFSGKYESLLKKFKLSGK